MLTDHNKTIVMLVLFHQLISVSFLTSNKLLNCKVVRNYILTVSNKGHCHGVSLLVPYNFFHLLRGDQGTIIESEGEVNTF